MREHVKQNRPTPFGGQATDWLLRWYRGRLSIAERHAYLQWLKTSPQHITETLRICRLYRRLKTGKLKSFLADEECFSRAVELPPSPDLRDSEQFEAEMIEAVRNYPVDTATLVRNALAALGDRNRRRRAPRKGR